MSEGLAEALKVIGAFSHYLAELRQFVSVKDRKSDLVQFHLIL